MIMQMLYHAGLRVGGKWPDFEPEQEGGKLLRMPRPLNPMDDWVDECEALKLLEPADNPIREGTYRVIWLDRNLKEQAKSWGKFRRVHMTKAANRKAIGAMRLHMKRNRERQLRVANRLSEIPPLMLTFEAVVPTPLAAACAIRDFIGRPDIDVKRMAAGVLNRKPECHDEFLESKLQHMRLA
jgi:hypothetical protein